jgi:hypothetical protein
MSTLSPNEFKLYIQKMSIKYAVGINEKEEQKQEQIQEQDYEDLKRENESLKKLVMVLLCLFQRTLPRPTGNSDGAIVP